MKKPILILAMLLGLVLPSWANGSVEFAQKATDRINQQQSDQGLEIQWKGLGRVAGRVVEASFRNTGQQPLEIGLVPGMVLTDSGGRWEPLMLEGVTAFRLEPGQSLKRKLRGYGLDHSRPSPRGTGLSYQFSASQPYAAIVKTVWAALRLEKEGKIKPALAAMQYRTIVLQRAIWATLGGDNPATEEKLRFDLLEDAVAGGHSFSEQKIEWLAKRIWKDVESVRAAAKREA